MEKEDIPTWREHLGQNGVEIVWIKMLEDFPEDVPLRQGFHEVWQQPNTYFNSGETTSVVQPTHNRAYPKTFFLPELS